MRFGEFQLRHEERGQRSELEVVGELDIAAAPQLRRVVGALMGTGVREMRVDLGSADFLDSSGLAALLWAEHRLRAVGGTLIVVNAPDGVRRTIELAGLDDVLLH